MATSRKSRSATPATKTTTTGKSATRKTASPSMKTNTGRGKSR